MVTGVGIIIIHIVNPHSNTDRATDAIFSFVSAILGALLGLIAGKRIERAENGSSSQEPPSA
jgi:hypothetical protein